MQHHPKIKMKGLKRLLACFLFAVLVLVLLNVYHAKQGLSQHKSLHVDKHFFFDLLQQVDASPRLKKPYTSSSTNTIFANVMDRTLLVRYLVERFAFSSFLQLGCRLEPVVSFMPSNLVTVGKCVDISDSSSSPASSVRSLLESSTRYDVIMLEPHYVSEEIIPLTMLLLRPGGAAILTDTVQPNYNNDYSTDSNNNNSRGVAIERDEVPSHVRVAVDLQNRLDLDSVTLDVDGGLTVVLVRSNSHIQPIPLVSKFGSLRERETGLLRAQLRKGDVSTEKLVESDILTWTRFWTHRVKLLHIVSFETLHEWLAPTSNVDAVTAFGGPSNIRSYDEAKIATKKCVEILVSTSQGASIVQTTDSGSGGRHNNFQLQQAADCFQQISASNRITLRGRWLYALLLLRSDRLVDGVTKIHELQALSPLWHKWLIQKTVLAAAAELHGESLVPLLTESPSAVPTPSPEQPIPPVPIPSAPLIRNQTKSTEASLRSNRVHSIHNVSLNTNASEPNLNLNPTLMSWRDKIVTLRRERRRRQKPNEVASPNTESNK